MSRHYLWPSLLAWFLLILTLVRVQSLVFSAAWIPPHADAFIAEVQKSDSARAGDPEALWEIYKRLGGGFFPFGIKSYRLAAAARRQRRLVPRIGLATLRTAWRFFNYVPWVSAVIVVMAHLPVSLSRTQSELFAVTGCLLMFGTIVIAMEGLLAARCLGAWASIYHRFPKPGQAGGRARAAEYYLLVGGSIFAVMASWASIDLSAARLHGFPSIDPHASVATVVGLSLQAAFTGLLTFSGPDPRHVLGYLVHDLGILQSIAYVGVLLQIILALDDAPRRTEPGVTGGGLSQPRVDDRQPTVRTKVHSRWVVAAALGVYVVVQLLEHHGGVIRP
ncbi:MAG: hypothetical protein QOD07_1205 [Frankiaceae bacterium]|nr:hypothetical protein [Frankiaceae bacterium]